MSTKGYKENIVHTIEFVRSPTVGDVELFFAVEKAETYPPIAFVWIFDPFRSSVDPLLRTQTGHQQGHCDTTTEKRHEYHATPEQVHFYIFFGR